MKHLIKSFDGLSRRQFCTYAARAFLGLGILQVADLPVAFAAPVRSGRAGGPGGRAVRNRNIIYLFMDGGMSHLDTFDPKPGMDVQGPVQAIDTSTDGVRISEHLPLTARHMDKAAVVRSMTSTQGAHDQGRYFMHTSYTALGTILHPAIGAWMLELQGRTNDKLPGNVLIGGGSQDAHAGFFDAKHAPLVIGNPYAGLQNSRLPDGVTPEQFNSRMTLARSFDRAFRTRYDQSNVRAYADMYDDAIALMRSKEIEAFDIKLEPQSVREAYGDNAFGQGCLLARRLVEADVRCVEVNLGNWDHHVEIFEEVPQRARILDQALATLLHDLEQRDLLDQTLVVLATEFGRTPTINVNKGRDHFPQAFSCLLAGAGVKAGQAYGKTDASGAKVIDNPVTIPDFNATIAAILGLPLEKVVMSPNGRPFTVANKGKPVAALMA